MNRKILMLIMLLAILSLLFLSCKTVGNGEKFNSTINNMDISEGTIVWDGDSVIIYDGDDVKVELSRSIQTSTSGSGTFRIGVYNKCEKSIGFYIDNITINNSIESNSTASELDIIAGDTAYCELELGNDMWMANVEEINSFDFQISTHDAESNEYITEKEKIHVDVKNMGEVELIVHPILGAYTENQTVVENDTMKIVVDYMGEVEEYDSYFDGNLKLVYYVENLSDEDMYFECNGISINGKTIDTYDNITISSGARWYGEKVVSSSDLEMYGIENIYSVEMCVNSNSNIHQDSGEWYPVNLLQQGVKDNIKEKDGEVVYDKYGIKIIYLYTEEKTGSDIFADSQYWRFYIYNESEHSIDVSLLDAKANQQKKDEDSIFGNISMIDGDVGKGQERASYINLSKEYYEEFPTELKLKFFIIDSYTHKVIDKSDEECVITSKMKQEEAK